jgi:hypothetical protein
MKNSACRTAARFAVLAICLTGLLFVTSCSKNDSNSTDIPAAIAPSLPGQWMIHYYFNVTEQSAIYVDYTFTFNSNGTFTASKAGSVSNGTWKEEVDSGKRKLTLDFDASVTDHALLELEEDWIVATANSSLINLQNNAVVTQFMKM